jgi:subtilisin family serine protease
VIVDDVAYFEEPFFQDGPVAAAIDKVVGEGDSYFTAAGNDNLIAGENDFSSWEAPEFRDSECPPELQAPATPAEHCLDFNPDPDSEPAAEDNTFGIKVEKKEVLIVDVQWAEPWEGVNADIDAYLLDEAGKPIAESTENNVGAKGTQMPVEVLAWENPGAETEVQLVIDRCFSKTQIEAEEEKGCNPDADPEAKPRVKLILLENGSGVSTTEYPESSEGDVVGPSIYGHAGAAAASSVAAVQAGFLSEPEEYSSRGPVTHYFGPVEGSEPAPPLEETIPKPDIAAVDCTRTSFFFPSKSGFIFCGTSAAAPHAAAIAALMRQANPGLSPENVVASMASTAKPVGVFGPDAVGAGLLDAYAALGGTALPPEVTITGPPAPLSRNPSPTITFAANRKASFMCSIDGGALFSCTSPFTPHDPLSDGLHGFAVRGEDLAGRVGIAGPAIFQIDTTAPRTFIRSRPRRTLRTRHRRAKARFAFAANEQNVTFACRVDGGLLRFCPERLVRRFKAGRHRLRVIAVDAAGNADRTPAMARFRVKRVGAAARR